MLRRATGVLQRFVVRTQGGRMRPLWAALYAGVMHAVAAYLSRGGRGAAVYVVRSLAVDDPVYGVSDIDLVVVAPDDRRHRGAAAMRLRRRWHNLCRASPLLGQFLLPDLAFYEQGDLAEAAAGSVLTYGLDEPGGPSSNRPAVRGPAAAEDEFALRSRPGVYGPMRDWRLVRGPDRRPPLRPLSRQDRRIAAWQELQFWWSFAFQLAADPDRPRSAFLCVKLVAEPARIWLALVDDAVIHRRRDALTLALERMPDEKEAIGRALELYDGLGRRPLPPIGETLPAFVRLTSRIAGLLREELSAAEQTPVRLIGRGEAHPVLGLREGGPAAVAAGAGLLPLADWRALAVPTLPDEVFRLVDGDPRSPADLARAARAASGGAYLAMRADGFVVLPALGPWGDRSYLRAVQCQPTDPVTFALADGLDVAEFRDVSGWSARDWARRAVAEHRADVAGIQGPWPEWPEFEAMAPPVRATARLLTAARAALFLESIDAGDPELALTAAAVAARLADGRPNARAVAESALEGYWAGVAGGPPPAAETVAALRKVVASLPAYEPAP